MSDRSDTVVDSAIDLARLSPLLVAFLFFAVAVMRAMNLGAVPAVETLVVGWLLVFPPLAAVVWTLVGRPAFVPWPFEGDGESAAGRDRATDRDPLDELRDRYARGDLSDEEFEERVDRLLETESGVPAGSSDDREPSVERE